MAEHLTAFLLKNKILDKFQSGFCMMHSTESALLKLSTLGPAGFDPVDNELLRQTPSVAFGLFHEVVVSYLTDRTFSGFFE